VQCEQKLRKSTNRFSETGKDSEPTTFQRQAKQLTLIEKFNAFNETVLKKNHMTESH
jgi:hypothetical protein